MIDALLSPEQRQFAESVSRFVEREYGPSTTRPTHAFDRARHRRLADLGVLALGAPEERGGFGGALEVMLAAERLGPTLAQEPFIGCGVVAASLLAASGAGSAVAPRLDVLMAGDLVVAPALLEAASGYDRCAVETRAEPVEGGWRLWGAKPLVECAMEADAFLVSARESRGQKLTVFLVERDRPGLSVRPRARLDGLPAGDVAFEGRLIPAENRLDLVAPKAALDLALDRAEAAEIAVMTGVMDALIRATIEYLKTRRQFGHTIGSFQALQHRVADMWIACEETRSLSYAAALAVGASPDDRKRVISLAKIRACDAAKLIGNEAIQMHGGVGMTDDLIVSHWHKRLLTLRLSLGDRRLHLARLAGAA
jgi:alkylation response protein AidB-like acyl-CoA dehydrogenase